MAGHCQCLPIWRMRETCVGDAGNWEDADPRTIKDSGALFSYDAATDDTDADPWSTGQSLTGSTPMTLTTRSELWNGIRRSA